MTHGSALESVSPNSVRIVLIGDIVGKPGMQVACDAIPWLKQSCLATVVIANAENAADGSGLRGKDYRRLVEAGVDVITLGDHALRKREIIDVLRTESNIVRPANMPPKAPGKACAMIELPLGRKLAVISALGRVFMKPADCPFQALDRELQNASSAALKIVDFHAEATSDMQLMGRYLDGRVSAVLGTHTHVATADEQILPGGTGFQCDVGMTGPFESILGRRIDAVMEATVDGVPVPFSVANGDLRLNATWVDVSLESGKCRQIGRLNIEHSQLLAENASQGSGPRIL